MDGVREQVRLLSSSKASSDSAQSESEAAAEQLLQCLEMRIVTPAELLQFDCIPPLLLQIQTSYLRELESDLLSSSTPSVTSPPHPSTEHPTALLQRLMEESNGRLKADGWIWRIDEATGAVVYVQDKPDGLSQSLPPTLPHDESSNEPEWVNCLFAELPLLITPRTKSTLASSASSSSTAARGAQLLDSHVWAARVRFHLPAADAEGREAVTVVDLRPEVEGGEEEDASESAGTASNDSAATEGVSRQLVIGGWQGIGCTFRESEADLSYAPGEQLENWYTVTMASMGILLDSITTSTASATSTMAAKKRVLIIGLGGGSLVSFLTMYLPSLDVEVVEINADVVNVAEAWFGVNMIRADGTSSDASSTASSSSTGAPSSSKVRTPVASLHPSVRSGFAFPSAGSSCRVHTVNAHDFLRNTTPGSFDLILLDVYTSGIFPPALLCQDFFACIQRSLNEQGSVAINAGIGSDRQRVLQLCREVFTAPKTKLLIDRKESCDLASLSLENSTSETAENAVVLAGGLLGSDVKRILNLVDWRKKVMDVRQNLDAQPLPFQLASIRTSEDTSRMQIGWKGAELDSYDDKLRKQKEREQRGASAATTVKKASSSDAAWALFD